MADFHAKTQGFAKAQRFCGLELLLASLREKNLAEADFQIRSTMHLKI
jgi:hypothetical protein